MTRAEQLFEKFCSKNGIKATAIPTGGRKTPDYRLSISGQEVIAEVKQLDPNDEEKADLAKFDQGMLVKLYGEPAGNPQERRYSAGQCCGTITGTVCGDPDPKHVSTSFAERQNLTMRMSMRRFTRLTNGFSKKLANLEAAVSLHFMFYNLGRIHKTLRVTPAMEAKISDHVWSLEEIAKLAD